MARCAIAGLVLNIIRIVEQEANVIIARGKNFIVDSFVDGEGGAVVAGKLWKWEFHEYLGPTFLNVRTGQPKKYPPEKHPIWAAFDAWLKEYYAENRLAASQKGKRK